MGAELLERLRQGAVDLPDYRTGQPIEVTFAGAGETYVVWRVRHRSTDVLLRLPFDPAPDSQRSMVSEFAALGRVPQGLGPRGLSYSDTDENPLGLRHMLTTYLPGQAKTPTDWTDDDLAGLAGAFAALHRDTTDLHGPVDAPTGGSIDLVAEMDSTWQWWSQRQPDVVAEPEIAHLWERVREYVGARASVVARLTRFPLVHGDACATNVLIDHGVVRLIDWEWAEYSDPARDLALIGGEVYGGPWYVPMDSARVSLFLLTYARLAGLDGSALGDLDARRQAWLAYDRFMTGLLLETRARSLAGMGGHGEPDYRGAAITVRATLGSLLDRG